MRTTKLLATLLVAALAIVACKQDEDYVLPSITLSTPTLDFSAATEQSIDLLATRDWQILGKPEWVQRVEPDHGPGTSTLQRIRLIADPNEGYNREDEIVFTIGLSKATLSISQPGAKGEIPVGTGTKDDPYTVKGAMDYVSAMAAGAESPSAVYIKGKISEVVMTFGGSGTYGNANFYISDDGSYNKATNFYCFQVYYLGGVKWKTGDEEIKVGDDVIIYGKVTNYGGNTPETTGKGTAYIYELNGVSKEASGGGGQGGGEQVTDKTVFSNNFDKEAATQTFGTSNNAWPYLDQFEGWKNEKGSGVTGISYEFDKLTVRNNSQSNGTYSDYSGSGTNNLLFGAAGNFLRINNIKISSTNFALSFGATKYVNNGDSTFIPGEFHVYISNDGQKWVELTYSFPNGAKSGRWDQASTTFTIPSGTTALSVYFKADVASSYRLDDVNLEISDSAGTSIDFSAGVSLEGGGSSSGGGNEGGNGGGGQSSTADIKTVSIAEFLAAADSNTQKYQLTGKISNIVPDKNDSSKPNAYGNFDLTDDSGTVYVYGLTKTELGYGATNDKSFASLGLKADDTVTIIGYRGTYNDKPEVMYAYYVSHTPAN